MDIDRGTLTALLLAIERRLHQKVPGLDQGNCFVSDAVIPAQLLQDWVVTISTGDGVFPPEFFAGGGHDVVTYATDIKLGIFRRYMIDRNDQSRQVLISDEKGLFAHDLHMFLRVLLVDDSGATPTAWHPVYKNKRFLRDDLAPDTCSRAMPVGPLNGDQTTHQHIVLTFKAVFDWSL